MHTMVTWQEHVWSVAATFGDGFWVRTLFDPGFYDSLPEDKYLINASAGEIKRIIYFRGRFHSVVGTWSWWREMKSFLRLSGVVCGSESVSMKCFDVFQPNHLWTVQCKTGRVSAGKTWDGASLPHQGGLTNNNNIGCQNVLSLS